MNRKEFTERVAKDMGVSVKNAKPWVDGVLNSMANAMIAEDVVRFSGIGVFCHETRKPRMGRNARTGEPIAIPAKVVVKFTPAQAIADEVRNIAVPDQE